MTNPFSKTPCPLCDGHFESNRLGYHILDSHSVINIVDKFVNWWMIKVRDEELDLT